MELISRDYTVYKSYFYDAKLCDLEKEEIELEFKSQDGAKKLKLKNAPQASDYYFPEFENLYFRVYNANLNNHLFCAQRLNYMYGQDKESELTYSNNLELKCFLENKLEMMLMCLRVFYEQYLNERDVEWSRIRLYVLKSELKFNDWFSELDTDGVFCRHLSAVLSGGSCFMVCEKHFDLECVGHELDLGRLKLKEFLLFMFSDSNALKRLWKKIVCLHRSNYFEKKEFLLNSDFFLIKNDVKGLCWYVWTNLFVIDSDNRGNIDIVRKCESEENYLKVFESMFLAAKYNKLCVIEESKGDSREVLESFYSLINIAKIRCFSDVFLNSNVLCQIRILTVGLNYEKTTRKRFFLYLFFVCVFLDKVYELLLNKSDDIMSTRLGQFYRDPKYLIRYLKRLDSQSNLELPLDLEERTLFECKSKILHGIVQGSIDYQRKVWTPGILAVLTEFFYLWWKEEVVVSLLKQNDSGKQFIEISV